MLYPLHLLLVEASGASAVRSLPSRAWRRRVLIPRQLCLFESVPCAGVRLHEMARFVQLQVQRLSPFARTGSSAMVRAGRLLLWVWDEEEVDRLLEAAQAGANLGHRVAEGLYLAPPADGASSRRCVQCEERIVVDGGALTSARLGRLEPADTGVILPRAQGWDWAQRWSESLFLTRLGGGVGLFNHAAWMAALLVAAWSAHHWAGVRSAERMATTLEAALSERTQRESASASAQGDSSADQQWLQAYEQQTAQLDVVGLLEALRPVLERHGAVIREWNSLTDRVSLMVVSAGGEFRLPQLTDDLAQVFGVTDLQLQDHDELLAARFSFRGTGWMVRARVEPVPSGGGS